MENPAFCPSSSEHLNLHFILHSGLEKRLCPSMFKCYPAKTNLWWRCIDLIKGCHDKTNRLHFIKKIYYRGTHFSMALFRKSMLEVTPILCYLVMNLRIKQNTQNPHLFCLAKSLKNADIINNHVFCIFNTTWQSQTTAAKAPRATSFVTLRAIQLKKKKKSMTLNHSLHSTSCEACLYTS